MTFEDRLLGLCVSYKCKILTQQILGVVGILLIYLRGNSEIKLHMVQ